MKLKDFVKTTLVEIVEGVKEAQEVVAHTFSGAMINPPIESNETAKRTGTHVYLESQVKDIHFDVAVAAREEASMKPGGGISIVVLKAGVEGEVSYENTAVNRIRFKVPIVLPHAEMAEEVAQTD